MIRSSPADLEVSVGFPCDRRGAASVEFAVTFMVLFLIFCVVVEFARTNIVRHTVDAATYEGARAAIIPGATANDALVTAQQILAAGKIKSATITVTPNPILENSNTVTVQIQAPLNANAWITPRFFLNRNVQSSCTLITERIPVIQAQSP